MKITEVHGFHLSFPLAEPMGNALNVFRKRDALLIQIRTDSGLSGWGEAGNSPHAAGAFIRARLAGLILGKSPADNGRHFQSMCGCLGYDRRGAAMMAISAIDIALHDLAAQMHGISVAALMGGAVRNEVFAYASGPFVRMQPDPYREYQREVDQYLSLNFKAIKPRGGVEPRADGTMANALRKQVGPDIGIMVDINQSYTAAAAIRAAKFMEDADLLWIEEPVQPEDLPGYQSFTRAAKVATAGGEALGSLRAFRDFLAAGTFDILQPDLSICGGYSGFRQIWALAQAYDLPIMPHVFGTAVNFHASLQMSAVLEPRRGGACAAYPFMEYDMMDNPLLRLAGTPSVDQRGMLAVPEGPGTGVDLRPEQLEQWVTDSWSERL
ncbi:mandelate racemase/muconate lactonizing enzyme family protein [Bradyrhizobium sp. 147]|uniref:mandelate racemase/muconate lactonizing enzyme family protein n=1 Tax=unclassified Bradyrhizobium TaxID=2631580 RepID=UPI001FFB8DF1|nr:MULTISPECIES: mandelate racemase/muconate lactonizing enzyme family protein [unclassified Bradyrhizobium]MCK1624257.1 mandelate racemase/muconate lactonizing enzyme family protein [Bradyrhizobium sp. 160]MCK1678896.1 mandelate racemase/muconate lactonizing enzyme family protein [Bradyrhizobium sp. 147]